MNKGRLVASRLPEEMVRDLELIERWEQTDRSTTLRKLLHRTIEEWKRDFYARQHGDGAMTLARAAQEAGVTLWEMMDDVRQRKIAAQYDLRDLEHDLAAVLG